MLDGTIDSMVEGDPVTLSRGPVASLPGGMRDAAIAASKRVLTLN
jgi:hypothetical protein